MYICTNARLKTALILKNPTARILEMTPALILPQQKASLKMQP